MFTAGELQDQPASGEPAGPAAAPPPRRAVPLTFNPIINDEVNILAALSRGDMTIPDLVEHYSTTMPAFSMWLMREDIQAKLATMTQAAACSIRIAAVNQLPKAVSALSFQIDGYIFDRTHNLIKPGLDADRVAATRDANVRKAAHLMLRLAKFDPSRPLYSPRPMRTHALPSTSPKGEVPAQPGEGAPAFSTGFAPAFPTSSPPSSDSTSHIPLPTSDIDERAPALSIAPPSSPVPDPCLDLALSIAAAKKDDHKGHANGRIIRHPKSSDSPPRSRPPPG